MRGIFTVVLVFVSFGVFGQSAGVAINASGTAPDAQAILDISSTTKGVLIPRMTTAERLAISTANNTDHGLLVFDLTTKSYWYWDGANVGSWVELLSDSAAGNTLDEAYDQGGPGAGRTITADAGAVQITGTTGAYSLDVDKGIRVAEDQWIGLGSTLERIEFDGSLDRVDVEGADITVDDGKWLGIDGSSPRVRFTDGAPGIIDLDDANLRVDNNTWIGLGSSIERFVFQGSDDEVNLMGAKMGIGTLAPSYTLTVQGSNSDAAPILGLQSGNDNNTFNNGAQIAFGYNGTSSYQHFIHTRHNTGNSNNAIDFYVSDGTQNNTVTSGSIHTMSLVSGNVGVGTTAPAQKLDVSGVINAASGYRYNNTNQAAGTYLRSNGTNFVPSTIQVSDLPSGSGNYIQNQTSSPQSGAGFWTAGTGRADAFGVSNTSSASGKGISLYNGPTAGQPTYGIMFAGTGTFGTHGYVTSDWATYLTMNNNSARGWVFKSNTGTAGNVASISGAGDLTINGRLRLGNNAQTELYTNGNRIHARAENVDGVAEFASYGMYLPRTGQTYNLYLGGSLKVGHGESGHIDINDANTRLIEGGGNAIRVQTNSGYIDIGAQNTGWGHIQTDRARFYFNKGITVDEGLVGSYDENLQLQTSGTTRITVQNSDGNVGIGTTGPTQLLDVNGQVRIRGGAPATGYVLSSTDGNGNATWSDPATTAVEYSGSVSAGNWYRIAQNNGGGKRAAAEFTLRDNISGGGHSTLMFSAGIAYNNAANASFTMRHHNWYNTPTFTKVRIVAASTYDVQYVEVYCARSGSVRFSIDNNLSDDTWVPVVWSAGSVPGGYTAYEYDVDKLFMVGDTDDRFTVEKGGQVGIGTSSPDDQLDVVGNAQVSGYLKVGNPGSPTGNQSSANTTLYGWMATEGINGWATSSVCGSGAGWLYDYSGSAYDNTWNFDNVGSRNRKLLYSPWVWVPSGASGVNCEAQFYCDLENNYDGVFMEYSTNGSTWTKITSWVVDGYPDNAYGSNTGCSGSDYQTCWNGGLGYRSSTSSSLGISGTWVRFRFVGMEDASNASGVFALFGFSVSATLPGGIGGSFTAGDIYAENNIYAGSNVLLGDIAEYFKVSGTTEPGDLISINPRFPDAYMVTNTAKDKYVLGVHSTNPTVTLNDPNSGTPVALRGRVPVKVCGEGGAIRPGDPLTASSIAGHAMKANGRCYIVGRALESFNGEGTGKILCLLENGWHESDANTGELASGSFSLIPGKKNVTVFDSRITKDSRIFFSMLGDPGSRYWVSEKQNGAVTIALAEPAVDAVVFDYLVENADAAQQVEADELPLAISANEKQQYASVDLSDWLYDADKNIYWRKQPDQPTGRNFLPAPEMVDDTPPPAPEDPNGVFIYSASTGLVKQRAVKR